MRKKKVAIVGIVGLPPNYGGFETLVNYLTLNKYEEFLFTVYCEKTKKKNRLSYYNGSKLIYLPLKANGFQSIIYDIIAIIRSWFTYDTILILGTPGCVILPFLRILKKTNTVVNFGGLEWKRDKWNKIVLRYLKLTEKLAIKYSDHIVADNQFFCDYISSTYNKKSTLIEYGGNHTQVRSFDDLLLKKYPFLSKPYDVSVSRAQPDNNLHLVLEAYAKNKDRNLVLISNYDKFEYGRKLKQEYANVSNIHMLDAVYDQEELDTIRSNAQLYIHSHSFCGTAPSLVEAMSLGLPIISFDAPTNIFATENEAMYFQDVNGLLEILQTLNQNKLDVLKNRMKNIAEKRYLWKRISNMYAELF